MARNLKIRAHEIDGQVIVKSVINHPMETGRRKVKKKRVRKFHPILSRKSSSVVTGALSWKRSGGNRFRGIRFCLFKSPVVKATRLPSPGSTTAAIPTPPAPKSASFRFTHVIPGHTVHSGVTPVIPKRRTAATCIDFNPQDYQMRWVFGVEVVRIRELFQELSIRVYQFPGARLPAQRGRARNLG